MLARYWSACTCASATVSFAAAACVSSARPASSKASCESDARRIWQRGVLRKLQIPESSTSTSVQQFTCTINTTVQISLIMFAAKLQPCCRDLLPKHALGIRSVTSDATGLGSAASGTCMVSREGLGLEVEPGCAPSATTWNTAISWKRKPVRPRVLRGTQDDSGSNAAAAC